MIWGPVSEIRAMAVPPVDLTLTLKREYAMAIATGEKSWEARHLTRKGKLFHLKAGDRVSFHWYTAERVSATVAEVRKFESVTAMLENIEPQLFIPRLDFVGEGVKEVAAPWLILID